MEMNDNHVEYHTVGEFLAFCAVCLHLLRRDGTADMDGDMAATCESCDTDTTMGSSEEQVVLSEAPQLHEVSDDTVLIGGEMLCSRNTLPECTICIGTSDSKQARMLGCGHAFCSPCIINHFTAQSGQGQRASCPNCKRRIASAEMPTVFPERSAVSASAVVDTIETHSTHQASPQERRNFESYARSVHLKLCPHCGAHVLKAGGCNQMTCRCGRRFNWATANPVVPCNKLHRRGWKLSKCHGCTAAARAKYYVARSGQVTLVEAPACIAGLAGAAAGVAALVALASVPLAVLGPLGILYEPIRLLRGPKTHNNYLARGALAGFVVPAFFVMMAFQEDDD